MNKKNGFPKRFLSFVVSGFLIAVFLFWSAPVWANHIPGAAPGTGHMGNDPNLPAIGEAPAQPGEPEQPGVVTDTDSFDSGSEDLLTQVGGGGGDVLPTAAGGGDTTGDRASGTPTGGGVPGMDCSAGVCFPTSESGINLPTTSVTKVLITVLDWITGIFVMIAVIIFVICGMKYLAAVGDDQAAEDAKRCLKWTIVGVIVAGSAIIIIRVITALLFGPLGSIVNSLFR